MVSNDGAGGMQAGNAPLARSVGKARSADQAAAVHSLVSQASRERAERAQRTTENPQREALMEAVAQFGKKAVAFVAGTIHELQSAQRDVRLPVSVREAADEKLQSFGMAPADEPKTATAMRRDLEKAIDAVTDLMAQAVKNRDPELAATAVESADALARDASSLRGCFDSGAGERMAESIANAAADLRGTAEANGLMAPRPAASAPVAGW